MYKVQNGLSKIAKDWFKQRNKKIDYNVLQIN